MGNFLKKLVDLGGFLSGWKTIAAFVLVELARYVPGFPQLDIAAGIAPQDILLALAALKKFLERFSKK